MQISRHIKYWAEEDQPIFKMLQKGAKYLSDVELIAILLQHGTAQQNAVELARTLLQSTHHNLKQLAQLSIADILALKINGIGKVKAVRVLAAIELGSRRIHKGIEKKILDKAKMLPII